MSEKPASIEIMDQLAITGWMPCYWGEGGEVWEEHEATRREQWIVSGDVHLYTGRKSVDDEWDRRIWVDSLIGYPVGRKEAVPVTTLEGLVSELAPFLDKYREDHGWKVIHPVIRKLMGGPDDVERQDAYEFDGETIGAVDPTRFGFTIANEAGKPLMTLCVNGDDCMYLGGTNAEDAHTVIDMMSGELLKCDAEVEDAADFWMGILSLREVALQTMGRS